MSHNDVPTKEWKETLACAYFGDARGAAISQDLLELAAKHGVGLGEIKLYLHGLSRFPVVKQTDGFYAMIIPSPVDLWEQASGRQSVE